MNDYSSLCGCMAICPLWLGMSIHVFERFFILTSWTPSSLMLMSLHYSRGSFIFSHLWMVVYSYALAFIMSYSTCHKWLYMSFALCSSWIGVTTLIDEWLFLSFVQSFTHILVLLLWWYIDILRYYSISIHNHSISLS